MRRKIPALRRRKCQNLFCAKKKKRRKREEKEKKKKRKDDSSVRWCIACRKPIKQHAWWNSALAGPCCSSACVQAALDGTVVPDVFPVEPSKPVAPPAARLSDTRRIEEDAAPNPPDNPLVQLLAILSARDAE